ncbi:lecithin retinol acyltransferase b, tandem duplicate 2 [Esox lucius]|uniref:Lecithin retinol acyltransferase b, tandem duplicate 2 n=1 Tax=Esox lucius TaxID=8010 RepID=A0AAY5KF28_ESOLU|nr:lecithin retinol acyltransferase b, tandem duplicate 2 [Esox lucius]
MFPLNFLSLIFITAPIDHGERKKREKTKDDPKAPSKYDSMFQRGDLLEVPRTLFTHFGIYLGGGRVAHLIPDILPVMSVDEGAIREMVTNSRLILGVIAKCASVRVDSVEDFAYGSEIIVNPMDKVCSRPPLAGTEVARRAEKLQGSVAYSLLWYNCEHYVMYCRYGTCMSYQTFQFCKTVKKLILNRRNAKLTAVLGPVLMIYLGVVSPFSALVTLLVPFIIWMAS